MRLCPAVATGEKQHASMVKLSYASAMIRNCVAMERQPDRQRGGQHPNLLSVLVVMLRLVLPMMMVLVLVPVRAVARHPEVAGQFAIVAFKAALQS